MQWNESWPGTSVLRWAPPASTGARPTPSCAPAPSTSANSSRSARNSPDRRRRVAPPGSPVNRLRAALDLLERLLERRGHHRQRSAVGKVQEKRADHQTCYFSGNAGQEEYEMKIRKFVSSPPSRRYSVCQWASVASDGRGSAR